MANKLQISSVGKVVPFTKEELKQAAIHGIELPSIKAHQIELPDTLVSECLADLKAVAEGVLARVAKASGTIDKYNGEGYTEMLIAQHKVIFSLFSSKAQNKAAKLLAVKNGVLDSRVMVEKATAIAEDSDAEAIECDI